MTERSVPAGAPSPSAAKTTATTEPAPRLPLSRERVLRAAIDLADESGLDALSMRKLGQALGVEAMSLYKHVASKDDILDGMAELISAEFEVPSVHDDWKAALRRSAVTAHAVLRRHPWASSLIESRTNPGPARLRYADAVIGVLRGAGFDLPTIARAFMAIDSHIYGFTLQELAWPVDPADAPQTAARIAATLPPGAYPNLVAMTDLAASLSGPVGIDFEFGLDLILDGLERLRGAD